MRFSSKLRREDANTINTVSSHKTFTTQFAAVDEELNFFEIIDWEDSHSN